MDSAPRAEPRSICVVWIGRLGDFLITFPFLRALRARFPGARITAVVGARGREAAELSPDIDEILALGGAAANLRLLWTLRRARYDLLIDLNSAFSKTSVLLSRAATAAEKLAFHRPKGDSVFTRTELIADELHMWDRYAVLAGALGAPYDAGSPAGLPGLEPLPMRADPSEEAAGREAVRRAGAGVPVVLIHPGNFKKFDNRWPEERFAELARRLLDRGDVAPVFVAGPGEEAPVRGIVAATGRALPVVGPMSLAATVGALREARLLIVNATGTAHLAALLRVPTFTFLSRYTAKIWMAPAGPLHHHVLSSSWESCRDIPVEEAWAALEPFLDSLPRRDKTAP